MGRHCARAFVLLCSLLFTASGHAQFGHTMLKEFSFSKGWVNLNQGSFGACPVKVQRARRAYQQSMDENPEAFFRVNMTGDGRTGWADLIDRARSSLARYLHTDMDNVVLVDNASMGLNAVLRSIAKFLARGRRILYLDTAYVEVKAILQYLTGNRFEDEPPTLQTPLIQVNITPLMPNITRRGVISQVEASIREHKTSIGLCAFSHITSTPGLVLPMEELIALCHKIGALVLVDGAHAPGHIPLNLTALQADFYVGNGHKWLFSPKGSAFLHVKKHVQKFVYPSVIDDGPGSTQFARSFIWQGTNDPSAMIAIDDALRWRAERGDSEIMRYMSTTAEAGGARLAALWGTSQMPPDAEERRYMQASLANIRVPCGRLAEPPCPADAASLSAEIVRAVKTWVPMGEFLGPGRGLWARVSAAVYTEVSDFELFGKAVLRALGSQTGHTGKDRIDI